MQPQVYYIAQLSKIDGSLDEFKEEYGDLPEKIKRAKAKVNGCKEIVKETTKILDDLRKFSATAKTTIASLKDTEAKLSKQQFSVRNNKEFDAITKEIDHSRQEYNKIIDEMRTVGVKEENLIRTLDQQKNDLAEAEVDYKELESEQKMISSDQNDDVKQLNKKRKEIVGKIHTEILQEYERIRLHTKDASVSIRKNSCSGCFSTVPPQKIVEIRNNLDQLFLCEHCGRILYPEDFKLV
ncbi:MAG: C4-type zinc ribbon domain-containing protein [FCB group bacterium]|jgi:predicted  nucleic acid-binding Zn-ribbon protein